MKYSHQRSGNWMKIVLPVGIVVLVGLTFALLYSMDYLLAREPYYSKEQYLEDRFICSDNFTMHSAQLHRSLITKDLKPGGNVTNEFCRIWRAYVECRSEAERRYDAPSCDKDWKAAWNFSFCSQVVEDNFTVAS